MESRDCKINKFVINGLFALLSCYIYMAFETVVNIYFEQKSNFAKFY